MHISSCDSEETSAEAIDRNGDLESGSRAVQRSWNSSWVDGLVSCLQPLWNKSWKYQTKSCSLVSDWEIPFSELRDMQYLASGAQGAVFTARYKREIVAVKKVLDASDLREVYFMRKLQHPNIVRFFGVCSSPGTPSCIIMELCQGNSLMDYLKKHREIGIAPNLVVTWAKEIAEGMHYLHSHKIVHRDLKSPNVLIARDGAVKISDFGTSRKWATESGEWKMKSVEMTFAGTIPWMSPEMVRSEKCSEKVDVWSYGVVLWELLTCEIPYKDVERSSVIYGIGMEKLKLPVPSTCPDGFQLLLTQCWALKPINRPSFRHILVHLDIAAVEILSLPMSEFHRTQEDWRVEIGANLAETEAELRKYKSELSDGEDCSDDSSLLVECSCTESVKKLHSTLASVNDAQRDVELMRLEVERQVREIQVTRLMLEVGKKERDRFSRRLSV
ncbi:unnamed protein product [Notodromas monacha]|uniref:Protein kinase domain-containing protein n=1 Tax=Notodromas monacha TaxID=399045 RepID=A0A7R9BDU7_9CRUS|nr:unnamed protein product [Notodromas monacha]CAG0913572.1 unnamed protein product [Notodromas monacha]